MNRRKLGEQIKAWRESHGLNQVGIAKVLGCSQSRVSKIESGRLEPSALDIGRLFERLEGIDLWVILHFAINKQKKGAGIYE